MSLGRGLESLIPQKQNKPEEPKPNFPSSTNTVKPDHVFYIEIDKINPNPHQPRRDFDSQELENLAESIRHHGILQPLLVSKNQTEVPSGTKVEYQLIAGERRLRAAKLAGLKQVPVIIKMPDESTKLELALIENVQRQDLNPMEEAAAYDRLIQEFNMTQAQVAQKAGKSREVVANKVRLLDLAYDIQLMVAQSKITEGHAKVLLYVKNLERQRHLAGEVVKKQLSARDLEQWVKDEATYTPRSAKPVDLALEEYKKAAQEALGTTVFISGKRERGKLAISYYSEEDLERLIKRLTG